MSKRTMILAALAILLFIAALVSLLIEKNEEIKNIVPIDLPEDPNDYIPDELRDNSKEFNQDVKITPDDTREAENG